MDHLDKLITHSSKILNLKSIKLNFLLCLIFNFKTRNDRNLVARNKAKIPSSRLPSPQRFLNSLYTVIITNKNLYCS